MQKRTTLAQELNEFVCNKEVSEAYTAESLRVTINETVLYKKGKIRPNNLEKLFKALITIQPTNVKSERAFPA